MEMNWTSVKDELPRAGMLVMVVVVTCGGDRFIRNDALYNPDKAEWEYVENGVTTPFWADRRHVTHWMRYPTLPD